MNLALALRFAVGVTPKPHLGGAFEGRQCQRIARRLSAVIDLFGTHAPAADAAAYRVAYDTWKQLLPVLTRTRDSSEDEAARFGRGRLDSWMACAWHFRGLQSLPSCTRSAATHRTSSICLGARGDTASRGLSRGTAISIRTPLTTHQTASSAAVSRMLSGQLSAGRPAATRTTEDIRGHHPRPALERGMPNACRTRGPIRGSPGRALLAGPPHAC